MPTTNLQSTIYRRQYYIGRNPDPVIDPEFEHTPAAGKPAAPALPGVLNREAYKEFLAWQSSGIAPTHPHALAKKTEFEAYHVTPAYKAWLVADKAARRAQARGNESDANEANEATTPISASATGTPGTPPPAYIPPGANTP